MKRWDILNKLINKFSYESYLEIGTQNPNSNFNKINCSNKISVEPFPEFDGIDFIGTSDEYFSQLGENEKFDLIFIDGLHHYEEVLKDVENSLKHLNENGSILCHDCLPTTEKMQIRDDHGGEWTGDVWKAMFLLMSHDDLDVKIINTDYGCGLIRKGNQLKKEVDENNLNYTFYSKNKNQILNIISVDKFNGMYG